MKYKLANVITFTVPQPAPEPLCNQELVTIDYESFEKLRGLLPC